MKKLAALLSATMMINLLATSNFGLSAGAFDTEQTNEYEVTEDVTIVEVDEEIGDEADQSVNADEPMTMSTNSVTSISTTENQNFGEWSLDLSYYSPVGDGMSVINFPNAEVSFQEETGAYSISVSVTNGTIMSKLPAVSGANYTISSAFNLAKTEVVYTFSQNGTGVGISEEDTQAIIRQIVYTRSGSSDMSISVNIDGRKTMILDDMTIVAGTGALEGHYYAYVGNQIKWSDAYNEARSMYYKGMQGYLVTITRAEEDYILEEITTTGAWSGGTRARNIDGSHFNGQNTIESSVYDGYENYYWSAGPEGEVGLEYTYTSSGKGTSVANDQYTNWNSNEPNNGSISGEAYMQVFFTNYKWNDLADNNYASNTNGYFVEFGDVAVPTSGDQPAEQPNVEGNGNATDEVVVTNLYLTIEDKIYDGEAIEVELLGASDSSTLEFYLVDENGNKTGNVLSADDVVGVGEYIAILTDGATVLEQKFEIFAPPISVDVYDTNGNLLGTVEASPGKNVLLTNPAVDGGKIDEIDNSGSYYAPQADDLDDLIFSHYEVGTDDKYNVTLTGVYVPAGTLVLYEADENGECVDTGVSKKLPIGDEYYQVDSEGNVVGSGIIGSGENAFELVPVDEVSGYIHVGWEFETDENGATVIKPTYVKQTSNSGPITVTTPSTSGTSGGSSSSNGTSNDTSGETNENDSKNPSYGDFDDENGDDFDPFNDVETSETSGDADFGNDDDDMVNEDAESDGNPDENDGNPSDEPSLNDEKLLDNTAENSNSVKPEDHEETYGVAGGTDDDDRESSGTIVPKTSDTATFGAWIAMMFTAMFGVVLVNRKKQI